MLAPTHLAPHQPRTLEHPEVLGDRVQRDLERGGEVRDPRVAEGETAENRPSRRIGDRRQRAVEPLWVVFNHLVECHYKGYAVTSTRRTTTHFWIDISTPPPPRLSATP